MIFFSLKAIKLARRISHIELVEKYEIMEEKLKVLLYSGSKKEYKLLKKEHEVLKQAMLYQYTPQYTKYLQKIQNK